MEDTRYTDLHRRMVRNVWLNLELLINDGIEEISEYDVQSLAFVHLARSCVQAGLRATRERAGKFDIVIYDGDSPHCVLEIKTYLKPNEHLKKEHFDHDLGKVAQKLAELGSERGYVLIAARWRPMNDDTVAEYDFLAGHLLKIRDWTNYEVGGTTIRLRPSRAERRGACVIYTWEIMSSSGPEMPRATQHDDEV